MRFFSNRQDNTTNSQIPNTRIETGWGVMTASTAQSAYTQTVTFQTAFTNKPIIIMTFGGDSTTNGGYGAGGNTIEANVNVKAISITTSNFVAYARKPDNTNYGANGFFWYQWMAIGV